jgi:hypothetical protein
MGVSALDEAARHYISDPSILISSRCVMSLNNEWILAIAICSVPFLLFGAAELVGVMQRRRFHAIARRSKSRQAGGRRV